MARRFYFSLCLAVVFSLSLMAGRPARVIITAGQSNTDGRCPNTELPAYIKALAKDTITFQRGAYNFCRISQNRTDGQFERFWPLCGPGGSGFQPLGRGRSAADHRWPRYRQDYDS